MTDLNNGQLRLDSLNERQREAVTYRPAPLLVLAGPGSGKTQVLTQRIAWLIAEKGARPEQILAVTFTNRAAEEMRERLESRLGEQVGRVWVYTFHATAVRILRRFGKTIDLDPDFAILDEDEQRHVVNLTLQQLGLSRELFPLYKILSYIGAQKTTLMPPARNVSAAEPALAEIGRAYEAWMREHNALDFDDLIRFAVALLRNSEETRQHFHRTLHHILVDEYQDINMAQWELLKLLAPPGSSITVVADDDQSIYGWRGSQPELIDAFRERYNARIVQLNIGYRCPPKILYGAQKVITRQRRRDRQGFMRSTSENDTPIFHYIFHDLEQEQRWLVTLVRKLIDERGFKPSDIGVLYRTHRLAGPAEQALLEAGFEVQRLHKESFFDERFTREIVRYLQLLRLPTSDNMASALNFPVRLVDELTMTQLWRLAEETQIELADLLRNSQDFPQLSPLTRARLQHFMGLLGARLPDLEANVESGVQSLFELLEALRSPWRDEDRDLLEGFMAFTAQPEAVELLAQAIAENRPLHILHPDTVDGFAAATILKRAFSHYLGVIATNAVWDSLNDISFGESEALVVIGNHVDLPELPNPRIDIISPQPELYSLSTMAWRMAQRLLIGYEMVADGRFTIYDVETTGANIRRDEIVEMAAARYEKRQPFDEGFQALVCPERGYIPPAATAVHGIAFADVADAPPIADVLPRFLDYVRQDTLVGHNIARFDNRFVDKTFGELHEGRGFSPLYVDTLRLARRLYPDLPRHTLEYLLHHFSLDEEVQHRSAFDVNNTAQLFYLLVDRLLFEKERESLIEFLPLVGLGVQAAGVDIQDENRALVHGAMRVLNGQAYGDVLLDTIEDWPDEIQTEAQALSVELRRGHPPVAAEDDEWLEIRDIFMDHVDAFRRYSSRQSLAAFIDYQALLTSRDTEAHMEDENAITLMTLHNAKGSEFEIVIIIGVEQDNLPLWRTLDHPDELAEERRVFYVGLTRAREGVYLFSVRDRFDGFMRSPSRFAFEIPSQYVRRFQIDAQNRVREIR
ncbi:MAG: UvrD-helicase domain-containing protein [Caldilineales bacterium]|nr:UvrD-helicase domain-containing protein [Caldilineales bacterium]